MGRLNSQGRKLIERRCPFSIEELFARINNLSARAKCHYKKCLAKLVETRKIGKVGGQTEIELTSSTAESRKAGLPDIQAVVDFLKETGWPKTTFRLSETEIKTIIVVTWTKPR